MALKSWEWMRLLKVNVNWEEIVREVGKINIAFSYSRKDSSELFL